MLAVCIQSFNMILKNIENVPFTQIRQLDNYLGIIIVMRSSREKF